MKYSRALNSLFDAPVAIEDRAMERMLGIVFPKLAPDALDVVLGLSSAPREKVSPTFSKMRNVAVLDITGIIVPCDDDDNDYFGLIGCDRISGDLAAAMDDDEVDAIIARFNSPGGSVLGVDKLAAAFRSARNSKPIVAVTDGGMMCSAAYYLGSQCTEIVASRDAILGSIGVYATMTDSSRMYENAGVKVNLIKAGSMKGAGTPGTPVTDAQIAERQQVVNTYYAMFTEAVAAGRNMPIDQCLALADGRAHIGQAAVGNKLADSIGTFDSVLTRLNKATAFHSPKGGPQAMTKEEEDKAKADATASERKRSSDLFAAFPKDATFANRMITEGKSLQEAKAEYSDVLQAKAASDEAARIAAEASRPRGFGNKALGRDGRTEGRSNADAAQAFSDAIDAYAKDHPGKTRAECASAVARANPDVQHAALEGANRAESVEGYRQYVAEDLRVGDKY